MDTKLKILSIDDDLVGSQSAVSWMKNDECLNLRAGNEPGRQEILSVNCTSKKFHCNRKARNNGGRQHMLGR